MIPYELAAPDAPEMGTTVTLEGRMRWEPARHTTATGRDATTHLPLLWVVTPSRKRVPLNVVFRGCCEPPEDGERCRLTGRLVWKRFAGGHECLDLEDARRPPSERDPEDCHHPCPDA